MPDTAYGTIIPLDIDSMNELLEGEKNKLLEIGDQLGIQSDSLYLVWGKPEVEIIRLQTKRTLISLSLVHMDDMAWLYYWAQPPVAFFITHNAMC